VAALREAGFTLGADQEAEIVRGKDFVQLKNAPFDPDLVFAPEGIERFEEALSRPVEVEGFPVCHTDDIIESKEASDRAKERESLPTRVPTFSRAGFQVRRVLFPVVVLFPQRSHVRDMEVKCNKSGKSGQTGEGLLCSAYLMLLTSTR